MPRGRKPGFKMPEDVRGKIQNSNILKALIEHVEGTREMSATQVTAGIALLRKVLPDLTSTESKSEVVHRYVARTPDKQATAASWEKAYAPEHTQH